VRIPEIPILRVVMWKEGTLLENLWILGKRMKKDEKGFV